MPLVQASLFTINELRVNINVNPDNWIAPQGSGSRKHRLPAFQTINSKDELVHSSFIYGFTDRNGPDLSRGDIDKIRAQISPDTQARIASLGDEIRVDLAAKNLPDELQAVLSEPSDLTSNKVDLHYGALRFSELAAIRRIAREGRHDAFGLPLILRPPRVLSANVLLVCTDDKMAYFQARAPHLETYPSHLHVFGGAFRIADPDGSRGNVLATDFSLLGTALRELHEESGYSPQAINVPLFVLSREVDTGYVQFNCLGLDLPREATKFIRDSQEGKVVQIPLAKLPDALARGEFTPPTSNRPMPFVPTGRALALTWLGAGAPVIRVGPKRDVNRSAYSNKAAAHERFWETMARFV